ncbi:hypothetical protein F5Y04DRAFT_285184 [Hypomontagnella monticulosa]|nr:hypothetical protein F5Y04DRAFT_285184 [Hypomontagnella monticulosa]
MKFSVAIFALFTTVAMAELRKVPRSEKPNVVMARQDGSAQVQAASMSNANGEAIPFNAANVYKDSTAKGL